MEKILIVDDAVLNRAILSVIFQDKFEVIEASDGDEACEIIRQKGTELSIIFLDLMMPKKNGLEVLKFMRRNNLINSIPVIMITGEATVDTDMKAYEFGADDIIYKPFAAKVVMRRALNLMEQYKYKKGIEEELKKRTEEVVESQKQMSRLNEFLVGALGSVVEFRSLESGDHVKRVMKFTKIILEHIKCAYPEYNLTDHQISLISQASALHDVGKIAIPDDILKAPRKLSEDEFTEMKKHTDYGCEILERFKLIDSEFYKYCYDIARWHHEKVDGKGYPDGLKGDNIPIYCQAVSVADCFDALVSERVYKPARSPDTAFEMIKNGECGAFSEAIMNCFEKSKSEFYEAVEVGQKGA